MGSCRKTERYRTFSDVLPKYRIGTISLVPSLQCFLPGIMTGVRNLRSPVRDSLALGKVGYHPHAVLSQANKNLVVYISLRCILKQLQLQFHGCFYVHSREHFVQMGVEMENMNISFQCVWRLA